jgi:hypothetical protein
MLSFYEENYCDLVLRGSFSPLSFYLDPKFSVRMDLITERCFDLFVRLHFLFVASNRRLVPLPAVFFLV